MEHEHVNCRYLLSSLSEYLDATLEGEICAEIERHLEECENCRVVVDTLRKTIYLVHATNSDPTIPEDVRERLYKQLNLDEFFITTNSDQ
jgi:anti-sigma factor (TIGR02949 family)